MQGAPQHVTIGLPREGLHEFDDLKELEKHPAPYRIHEIEGIIYNQLSLIHRPSYSWHYFQVQDWRWTSC